MNQIRPKLFVLDSSVLIHDPAALFRFQEHDLFLPMMVLEELDNIKKGLSEIARSARQVSRFLDELIQQHGQKDINNGLALNSIQPKTDTSSIALGKLYFQTQLYQTDLSKVLPTHKADNDILATALALQQQKPEYLVILVTKDINLRIKASTIGVNAEDYFSDQVLDDVNLLPSGVQALPADFWETHGKTMESWQEGERVFYRLTGPLVKDWLPGQCLYFPDENGFQGIVRANSSDHIVLELVQRYQTEKHSVWGITARNIEQNFALNLLMDPELDFVTLLGHAGTGKTLLSLAAGLAQTLEKDRFREIIMTRVTVPVGEDIGFLPGTEEEKMTPWMGALMDNLEVLGGIKTNIGSWERAATNDVLMSKIKIRSINFMRGRTFLNRYIIIDEAQNLTAKQMKTLITRAGPGSKIVCLGNIAQIDTPYLSETTSGLTYVVDRFRGWQHSGHITLQRGERSRLADYASMIL